MPTRDAFVPFMRPRLGLHAQVDLRVLITGVHEEAWESQMHIMGVAR